MARKLTLDMVLRRAPEVALRLYPNDEVAVTAEAVTIHSGPHTLAVLDAFSRPVTLSKAIGRLQKRASGAEDWMSLMATLMQLYEAGILNEEGESFQPISLTRFGFDNPAIHVSMLNDTRRTHAFLNAIGEVVHEGDIVVDIGTGTGVLAVGAALAGAKHVYAIEAGRIGSDARALFKSNGLGDRITLVDGWSSRVSLPEVADVLVTETIGNDPLGERVLESVRDARQRLLKPHARIIPNRVRIFVQPVTIPAEELNKRSFSREVTEEWRSWYDIDFSALVGVNSHFSYFKPTVPRDWIRFSEAVEVVDFDLSAFGSLKVEGNGEFVARQSGELNGLLVFFELQMTPTTSLSVDPNSVDEHSSWGHPVWVLGDPIEVTEGDRFSVSYTYHSWPYRRLSISRM